MAPACFSGGGGGSAGRRRILASSADSAGFCCGGRGVPMSSADMEMTDRAAASTAGGADSDLSRCRL